MGWRGAGEADGSASIGAYLFFGGLLMNLGAVGEVSSGVLCGWTSPSVDHGDSLLLGIHSLRSSSQATVCTTASEGLCKRLMLEQVLSGLRMA